MARRRSIRARLSSLYEELRRYKDLEARNTKKYAMNLRKGQKVKITGLKNPVVVSFVGKATAVATGKTGKKYNITRNQKDGNYYTASAGNIFVKVIV